MIRRVLRLQTVVGLAAGAAVLAAIFGEHGLLIVGEVLLGSGLALLWVPIAHVPQVLCSALAWRAVAAGPGRPSAVAFVWVRWVRESINALLPVVQVGGTLIGASLLAVRGMPVPRVAAATLVDVTLEAVSQVAFILLGLAALVLVGRGSELLVQATVGAALAIAGCIAFVLVQRVGGVALAERLFAYLAGRWVARDVPVAGIDAEVRRIYRDRSALVACSGGHMLSWLFGAAEIWVTCTVLGHPVDPLGALVIESLSQAIRSAAFIVPGALGVQEAGFLLLAGLFGIPPEGGLAIALARRFRELVLGAPGILAWQLAGRRRAARG